MPVLFTAPWMVMRCSPAAMGWLKVSVVSVGFDVRIMAWKIAGPPEDAMRGCTRQNAACRT